MKDESRNVQILIAGYFLVQAIAVLLWWSLLWLVPASVAWFHPPAWNTQSLFAFCVPDIVLLVGGSLVVAVAIYHAKPWAHLAVWAVTFAACYPTLYCLGASVLTGQAWFATACMACMSGLSLVLATMIGSGPKRAQTIRETRLNPMSAVFWTLLQTSIFWSVFLWILPMGIAEVQTRIGIGFFEHALQRPVALVVFALASLLGISSGLAMSLHGKGTPLPTATAPELVVRGPYRWVRNPMAVAGIAQGMAVGLGMGSIPVILYAVAGAFVWHFMARPVEEADLIKRFGDAYRQYCDHVPLWRPAPRGFETKGDRDI